MSVARCGRLMLRQLTKRYPGLIAVDAIDLEVESGEFLTLLGPSGSGKTTTLMMIAGFTAPSQGQIFLDDTPIAGMPPERREIGVVFQNYALFPHMSVFENVAFPLRMRRVAKATVRDKVQAALDLVQLSSLGGRLPRQLSGGQQQRVALARALVFSPRLLLMDEPLGALDKNLREQMQFELKRLHGSLGVTVVYVTHDQEEALTMSNRVALMNGGRIEQLGTAEELYERPRNRFVAEFIGESTLLEGRLEGGGDGRSAWFVSAGGPRLPASAAAGIAAGTPCLLVLRPERIALAAAGSNGGTGVAGEVEELIYVGDFTRYRVRGEGGLRFTVKVQNSRRSFRAREGTTVRLLWEPDDARIVPLEKADIVPFQTNHKPQEGER